MGFAGQGSPHEPTTRALPVQDGREGPGAPGAFLTRVMASPAEGRGQLG